MKILSFLLFFLLAVTYLKSECALKTGYYSNYQTQTLTKVYSETIDLDITVLKGHTQP